MTAARITMSNNTADWRNGNIAFNFTRNFFGIFAGIIRFFRGIIADLSSYCRLISSVFLNYGTGTP